MNWLREHKDDFDLLQGVLDKLNTPMIWLLVFLFGVIFGFMTAIQTMTWLNLWDIYCSYL
jgi:hypothetical protein